MLNKHTLQFLQKAGAALSAAVAFKYLESKESREKLVENLKEIGEKIEDATTVMIDKAVETLDKAGDEVKRRLNG